ncbi:nitroreductase family protein [Variovorax sp. KK3]|uniref:nitroreductase family protein n=1 Tax=Variovorax sp. KK3 TaxID=1855728 RepID=UPI00117C0C3A|nr:nitroreductase family protein [Variovorax sp. KK3]
MDALEAIHGRRSIRAYQKAPLSRALIEELLWAAVQAPTPPVSGTVPWKLCMLEGAERLAAYGLRAKEYARTHQPEGEHWEWPTRPGFEVFWGAPVLVLICAQAGNAEARYDCCRAGQNLLIAAHALGVGTCWIGAPIPWLRSEGVARELGMPEGYDAEVAVVMGVAAQTPVGQPRPRPDVAWLAPSASAADTPTA